MPDPDVRGRDELLDLLEERRRAFHKLPFEHQAAINDRRILAMEEMHDLLRFFLWHGRLPDEGPTGYFRAEHRRLG